MRSIIVILLLLLVLTQAQPGTSDVDDLPVSDSVSLKHCMLKEIEGRVHDPIGKMESDSALPRIRSALRNPDAAKLGYKRSVRFAEKAIEHTPLLYDIAEKVIEHDASSNDIDEK